MYDFIERIGREISMYDDGESSISASDFKHIELQIQAKRVEKVLQLCINQIRLIFVLSHLIEHQRDHFKLLFAREDAKLMEEFAQKWLQFMPDPSNPEFNAELNQCLIIMDGTDMKWKIQKVNFLYGN